MANDREQWKIWSARGLLVCTAIVFVWSLIACLENVVRFRNVEAWPTVTASNVNVVPKQIEITTQGRYGGATTSWVEVFTVDFVYSLDGVDYEGSHFTPDNRIPDSSLLPSYRGFPWLAFYSPRDPSLAVLVPYPYMGTRELMLAFVSGLILLTTLCRWGIWPNGRIRKDGLTGGFARHWFGWWCALVLVFALWLDARESRVNSSIDEIELTPEIERWLGDIGQSYFQASLGSRLPDFILQEDGQAEVVIDDVEMEPMSEPLPLSLRAMWERDKIRELLQQPHMRAEYGMTIWVSGILLSLYLVLSLLVNRTSRS